MARVYADHKAWRTANPEKWAAIARRSMLKRRYGITPEDYDRMLEEQEGLCAICRTDDPKGPGVRFAVDHDHASGRVRGLLCAPCNKALGGLKDSPELLREAANYLERRW